MPRRCPRTHKIRYPTEHAAQVALVSTVIARNRGKTKRQETRAYACGICGGWHLTSMPLTTTTRETP